MAKHAIINKDNDITAFYDDDVHFKVEKTGVDIDGAGNKTPIYKKISTIPIEAVLISDIDYDTYMKDQANHKFISGVMTNVPIPIIREKISQLDALVNALIKKGIISKLDFDIEKAKDK